MLTRERRAQYLKNTVFGIEDSLVSTVGLLSGVAIAGTETKTIILAGVVLIFVEAFAMGVGSLISEHSADEYKEQKDTALGRQILPSAVMFISYFIAGFIPLSPYLFLAGMTAFYTSIALSLLALFTLGVVSAALSGTKRFQHGLEMFLLGGVAIGLGVAVGMFVGSL